MLCYASVFLVLGIPLETRRTSLVIVPAQTGQSGAHISNMWAQLSFCHRYNAHFFVIVFLIIKVATQLCKVYIGQGGG